LSTYSSAIDSGKCVNRSKEALEETLEYILGSDESIVHSRSISKTDPSNAKSNHGDRVIADALGWKGMEAGMRKTEVVTLEVPVGSLAWRNKQRENRKAETENNRDGW
jgi:hypothetical protein